MKLYVFPPSPNSWRVLAALGYLGAEDQVEVANVNLIAGEHRVPEIQALNPTGRLPILVDGDLNLWESNAINQYLSDRLGPSSLYPQGLRERTEVNRWLSWQMCHFSAPASTFLWETMIKGLLGMGGPDQAKLAEAGEDFKTCAALLDGELAQRTFLCGDELSLADLSVASFLAYAEKTGMPVAGRDNLNGWYQRIAATPTWQKVGAQVQAMIA